MQWIIAVLLLGVGVQISTQDLVTLAPSEEGVQDTESTTLTMDEKTKVKPTIKSLHITSDIKYRYATTQVSSRVVNPSDHSGEAAFSVTLPESAFISGFLMEVKGKVYNAYIKEKQEAKAVYDQAVQAGQFAGHVALDARDSNQFTVSVNIEAQGKVTFNLTYEQLLTRDLGTYSNIININPQQVVEDMTVKVNIEEPSAIKDLEVPELQISNEVLSDNPKKNELAKIEDKSPTHKQITWSPTPEEQKSQNSTGLTGQFIVKYDVDREENPQQILVDEGYFVHFFAPENLPKLKKHAVFVLDYSGSMGGRKLEQLKDAMDKILSDLDSKDYFSIVIFQSIVEAWSPNNIFTTALEELSSWERESRPPPKNVTLNLDFVVQATPANIELARSYLANYSDLGATNIMGGLRTGLKLVNIGSEEWANESDPPQSVIVFLTDGQPNVEVYDTDEIINKTKSLNTKEIPIYSLAFGYGADLNFLRKLSLLNQGFARNIYEAADAAAQLKNFYKTIASPLLSNVTFSYLPGQVDYSANTKKEFPVFFKGSEIVVAGKIDKDKVKEKAIIGELSGLSASGFKTYPIIIDIILKPENRTLGHLEKTWAYLKIQQLLDKADALDAGDEKNKTKDKALEIALQYAFVTPLTSLVVVKPNETESAVETTKVQPDSGDRGPVYSSSPAGFGGYAPSAIGAAGMPGQSYQNSLLMSSLPNNRYFPSAPVRRKMQQIPLIVGGVRPALADFSPVPAPFVPLAPPPPQSEPLPISTMNLDYKTTVAALSEPHRVTLNDIKWIQQLLANSTTSDFVTVSVQDQQLKLALNVSDVLFGACQVNSESGECRHFQFCALDVFQNDISDYIPYQCPISGNYLGVCCPTSLH